MLKNIIRAAVLFSLIIPHAARAEEPIKLKLAFFSSDRSHLYLSGAKPFVDAVNTAGAGRVEIEVYISARLGSDLTQQSRLLRDGTADIAYIVHPYEEQAFPDTRVIELPGLYRDATEATKVFTQLVSTGTIRGFEDYYVIGLFASDPEYLHLRTPISSLAELKGRSIRANNVIENSLLKKLGANPVFIPITDTPTAILSGKVDGATVPPAPMLEFGIGRVTPYHFLLATSSVPQSLLMSRKKFDSLPDDVKAIIRRYSGNWMMNQYITINAASTKLAMDQIRENPNRTVISPSPADMAIATPIFNSIINEFAAESPHNTALVNAARADLRKLRGTNGRNP